MSAGKQTDFKRLGVFFLGTGVIGSGEKGKFISF